MVNDFKFHGKAGRKYIMSVYRGTNQAFISNYSVWMAEYRKSEDGFMRLLLTTINHEHLHKVLAHVKGQMASKAIDKRNIFGYASQQGEIGIKVPVDDDIVAGSVN